MCVTKKSSLRPDCVTFFSLLSTSVVSWVSQFLPSRTNFSKNNFYNPLFALLVIMSADIFKTRTSALVRHSKPEIKLPFRLWKGALFSFIDCLISLNVRFSLWWPSKKCMVCVGRWLFFPFLWLYISQWRERYISIKRGRSLTGEQQQRLYCSAAAW